MLEALVCGKDWLFLEKDVGMDNQVQYWYFLYLFVAYRSVLFLLKASLIGGTSWAGRALTSKVLAQIYSQEW